MPNSFSLLIHCGGNEIEVRNSHCMREIGIEVWAAENCLIKFRSFGDFDWFALGIMKSKFDYIKWVQNSNGCFEITWKILRKLSFKTRKIMIDSFCRQWNRCTKFDLSVFMRRIKVRFLSMFFLDSRRLHVWFFKNIFEKFSLINRFSIARIVQLEKLKYSKKKKNVFFSYSTWWNGPIII